MLGVSRHSHREGHVEQTLWGAWQSPLSHFHPHSGTPCPLGATSPALDKQVFVFLLKHMLVSPKLHVHL